MARDAALIVSWTRAVPGREAKALEAFREALEWWGKQAAEGRCGMPRAFGAGDASGGMLMVEGRSDVLYELMESEQYRKLNSKAVMVADDFRRSCTTAGPTPSSSRTWRSSPRPARSSATYKRVPQRHLIACSASPSG